MTIKRYQSQHITCAHTWLRCAGLKCDATGWHGEGTFGLLVFYRGFWHATVARAYHA